MANPFHVLIFFEAKAGKAETLGDILRDLGIPSRRESGCRYYESFADIEYPEKFTTIEQWDTRDQWQMHLKTPHVAKALAQLDDGDILTQPLKAQQLQSIS